MHILPQQEESPGVSEATGGSVDINDDEKDSESANGFSLEASLDYESTNDLLLEATVDSESTNDHLSEATIDSESASDLSFQAALDSWTVAEVLSETALISDPVEKKPCLLLEIPPEVRLEIYKQVVGKKFVHVETNWRDYPGYSDYKSFACRNRPRIRLEECHYDQTMEADLYKYLMYGPSDSNSDLTEYCEIEKYENGTYFVTRHPNCLIPGKRRYRSLDLRFLRTCKKIYEEAKYIHLHYTTFSFRSPDVFDNFMISIDKLHLENIRCLHFDISPSFDMEDWGYSLEEDAIANLPSLQKLYIWLDLASSQLSDKRSKSYMKTFDADVYYKRPFCMFRMCPLKDVKIFLNPGSWPKQGLPPNHISWEGIRKWCKDFEDRLLLKWDGPIDLLDA
ncbi:hypothetical protein TWF281_001382 [Arthrobotrys megalospora]